MPSAQLAILGASIRTMDPARLFASAVAIRDGVIVAVGDDATVRAACDGARQHQAANYQAEGQHRSAAPGTPTRPVRSPAGHTHSPLAMLHSD